MCLVGSEVSGDEEDLTNGLQEVQIPRPVTFLLWGWAKEEVYRAKEEVYRAKEEVYRAKEEVYRAKEEVYRAKEEVYRAKSCTMEQLEDRIRNVIANVPHDFLQKTVDSIPCRLRKLVDAAGAYTEF